MSWLRHFSPRSLRLKLLAASTLVEVVLLTLLIGNSIRLVDDALEASSQAALAQTLPMLNIAIAPYLLQGDYATLRDNLTEIVGDGQGSIRYVQAYDRNGDEIGRAGAPPPAGLVAATATIGDVLHVDRPLGLAGQEVGRVRFGLSMAVIAKAKQELLGQGLMIAGAEVVLTFALLSLLGYWLTRRLQLVIQQSLAVAGGDYSRRIEEVGNDEVSQLAHNFNSMIAAVQRRMAETRASGHEFQALFEQSAVGMGHISLQGKWLRINAKGVEMLGYGQASELIGRPAADCIHPDDRAAAIAVRQQLASGELPYHIAERRYLRRDGRVFWASSTMAIYRNEAGEPLYYAAVVQDISASKAAQLALEQNEFRYRRLVESTRMIPWEASADGRLVYFIGPQAAPLLGYSQEEWRTPGMLMQRIASDDWLAFSLALAAPKADLECRLLNRGGQPVWVAAFLNREDETDPASSVHGFFIDIGERKKTEQELNHYREHLEELVRERTERLTLANQELESFSYSISHDLRAPLRAIDGFAGMLQEDCGAQLDATGQTYLRRIHAAAKRMGELIDALLGLARLSRGELRLETVNLSELAAGIIEELKLSQPERSVMVRIEPSIFASADRRLLTAVLQNLLHNAWKYSSKKADAVIEFFSEERDDERVYCVRDNGAGFDPKYAERLFGVFQRLHASDEFEGTGVGLATCQRIVYRHGGRIWADARPGEGATFYFTLSSRVEA